MGDLLDIGAAWLARQQRRHTARDVTYARAASSVVVSAVKGQSRFEMEDGNGVRSTTSSIDYIVAREDLLLDGEEVVPIPGDRITDDDQVYEVMAIPGEPASRDTDQHRYQHRIHTKYIGPS